MCVFECIKQGWVERISLLQARQKLNILTDLQLLVINSFS